MTHTPTPPTTLDIANAHLGAAEAAIQQIVANARDLRVTKKGNVRCPYCDAKNPEIVELEWSGYGENTGEITKWDDGPSIGVSQTDVDRHTLAWACGACRMIVNVPGEIDVSW